MPDCLPPAGLKPRSLPFSLRRSRRAIGAVGGSLVLAGLLGAQTIVLDKVEVIEPPVVRATTVDVFASQTTTVGAEQLKALHAQDLTSALRRTPGVTIARYNPVGSFGGDAGGAILLRGLGSSRPGGEIKTTVDGVPKYNAVFNHPLLDLMSIDLASSVEVARRAAPLEAGNMFAGINLVSPRARQPGGFARVTAAAGSFGTFMKKVEAGGKSAAFDVFAGQSYRESAGDRPDSGGRLTNAVVHVGWQPNPQWTSRISRTARTTARPIPAPWPASGSRRREGTATLLPIGCIPRRRRGNSTAPRAR